MRTAVIFMLIMGAMGVRAGELILTVSPAEAVVRRGEALAVEASITNDTDTRVALVLPGDGSEVGWRTPITGWSLLAYTSYESHPADPRRFCGNMNSVKRSEVFTLQPGQRHVIREWVDPPTDLPAGRYRAVFYYVNDPTKKLESALLEDSEPGVEELISRSTACRLVSNEIVVIITPAVPPLLKRPGGAP